jgi:hypothetical protein
MNSRPNGTAAGRCALCAVAVVLVIGMIVEPAATQTYSRNQAKSILKAFVQAGIGSSITSTSPPSSSGANGGATIGSSSAGARKPVRHFKRVGHNIALISHPSILFDGAPIVFRNRPFEKDGVTWVSVREMAAWMNSQFNLHLKVDWNGKEVLLSRSGRNGAGAPSAPPSQVSPSNGDPEMMRGLYALWQGRVPEARDLFLQSSRAGNEDGRAFQEWVGVAGPDRVGVLRVRRDAETLNTVVTLDGVELGSSAFLYLVSAGTHSLRIAANGAVIREGSVEIEENRSFVCVLK